MTKVTKKWSINFNNASTQLQVCFSNTGQIWDGFALSNLKFIRRYYFRRMPIYKFNDFLLKEFYL